MSAKKDCDFQVVTAVAQEANFFEAIRNFVAFGNKQILVGCAAFKNVRTRSDFKACVRKAVEKWNVEAIKAEKADLAKITATATEMYNAVTGNPPNLYHELISGDLLHDIAVACIEAEDAVKAKENLKRGREEWDRSGTEEFDRTASSEKTSSPRIVVVPDQFGDCYQFLIVENEKGSPATRGGKV